MRKMVEAIYENGVFRPYDIAERAECHTEAMPLQHGFHLIRFIYREAAGSDSKHQETWCGDEPPFP
jgi:hypothetical protein